MELRILFADRALVFVPPTTSADAAPEARPWLARVGDLALAARARALEISSGGAAETSTIEAELDNRDRQAATLLSRPLRARAEVYDGADLYFAGYVQSIRYGTTLNLTIEA